MTPRAAVSVIVASRRRPDDLALCLAGLAAQDHPAFEVIVVGDEPARAAARGRPVRFIAFDAPNLSEARNLGLREAAGEIVAFIDDDAVALPGWLRALTEPFSRPEVAGAGGRVLTRGWRRPDWTAGTVDRSGRVAPLEVPEDRTTLHRGTPERAMTVLGTNMAFRRADLLRLGGFDPALRYYLDETDLCLRMAGSTFAVVPGAMVLHRRAANASRRADRALRDLTEIGASQAVFLRRHLPQPDRDSALKRFSADMRRRVLRQMLNGLLEPGDIVPVLETLAAGIRLGQSRELPALLPLEDAAGAFLPHPSPLGDLTVLAGRPWQMRGMRQKAQKRLEQSRFVVLIVLGPTAAPHALDVEAGGVWVQRGGLFGPSRDREPLFRYRSFDRRVRNEAEEWYRIAGNPDLRTVLERP